MLGACTSSGRPIVVDSSLSLVAASLAFFFPLTSRLLFQAKIVIDHLHW
jgi:hypothetical protein